MRIDSRTLRSALLMAGTVLGAMTLISAATFAGECPAGQVRADGSGQPPGAMLPRDVTDTVLASIDVAKEPVRIEGRLFRLRRLVIQPGGIVPWHEHKDRPAIIYTVEGEITEYASTCAVPIVHKAGDVSVETAAVAHWWQNTGSVPVVLLSADLLHVEADPHMM
jgi:quercetin dioxygenase-like cupin family protein